MFDLIGPVDEFEAAAAALGFEWLTSRSATPIVPSDDDEEDEDGAEGVRRENAAPEESSPARLYLTMPSVEGLRNFLARWRSFIKGESPPAEAKALWALFGYLQDVRVFSAEDRIDPLIKRYVEALVRHDPERHVKVEVDLWYRSEKQLRDNALETLNALLVEVGGAMLDVVTIEEIRYQAALVSVPAHVAVSLTRYQGALANADSVMTIRPQSYFSTVAPTSTAPSLPDLGTPQAAGDTPIAAIIDGYPIASHAALDGKIIVHEVDLTGAQVPVNARYHGTAMASLVVRDDLHVPQQPLEQKVVVVPVLTSNGASAVESTPSDKLPIKMIYRAIISLVSGLDGASAAFPNVVLVNHSICDEYAPFVKRPSPWAALLDYFSHEHGLMFVVSAGNIRSAFPMSQYGHTPQTIAALDPLEREALILLALEQAKGTRGLLSPAESTNSLTVGALHADDGPACPPNVIDPYPQAGMTNLGSALGLGVNRSIKPDVLHKGGRLAATFTAQNGLEIHGSPSQHLGQLVAAPDPHGGDLRHVNRISGTSNAAALVTRLGIRVAESIAPIFRATGSDWVALRTRAAILKALIVHSAAWEGIGDVLYDSYPPRDSKLGQRRRGTITRFLGFGQVRGGRVISGNDKQITLLADDLIKHDVLHEYRIPVPSAMLASRDVRRITITLAWTTPVLTSTLDYRGVTLGLIDEGGKRHFWKGVKRHQKQPTSSNAERGTVIHHVFEGHTLTRIAADPKGIFVGVQCRAVHQSCQSEQIPYALAVTLELAQSAKADIYTEVHGKARTRAGVRTRTK
ncbi:S8 family peptidase [Burkholderia oklahomensis]|uniref:S8 family peptidase n=1 Tax=Burkholderia TaxID=32008 RepID=UPI001428A92A|nr:MULTISPECIES: S8 family peptidase [Burkholderia]MDN7675449.1 S8 family peptidase [Burkholderia oklahomensis]